MIHTMYFQGIINGSDDWHIRSSDYVYYIENTFKKKIPIANFPEYQSINSRKEFEKLMKESIGDTFVFIITNEQMNEWNTWLKSSGLGKFITNSITGLRNENYPGQVPRLNLYTMTITED